MESFSEAGEGAISFLSLLERVTSVYEHVPMTTSLGLPAAEHVRSPMHCHSTSFHCISSYLSCGDFLSIFTAHNNGLSEDLCRSPELFTVLIVTVVIVTLLRCTVLLLQPDLYSKVMHLAEHCRPE